jgi:hypothetical protein
MDGHSRNDEESKARKVRQARDRRAVKKERKKAYTLLDDMKVLAVQEAITRAPRSKKTTTKDGRVRVYRIGAHVAAMVRQLLHWEGKGEADGAWIHKSEVEWMQSDAALTTSKQRTARCIAREEGLWEERHGLRPSDGRPIVSYRLNMWRVAQVVVTSEIENTKLLLKRSRHNRRKAAEYRKKLRKLEQASNALGLIDAPEGENPEPEVRGDIEAGVDLPIGKPDSRISEEENAQDAPDTPANLTRVACQIRQPTRDSHKKFRFASDTPVGANASPAGDAPAAITQRKEELKELIAAISSNLRLPRFDEEDS